VAANVYGRLCSCHAQDRRNRASRCEPRARWLAQFRAWFEEFEAARFDEEVERDAAAGKLDSLADEAVREFRKGRARQL
jgi:hypothetical protein